VPVADTGGLFAVPASLPVSTAKKTSTAYQPREPTGSQYYSNTQRPGHTHPPATTSYAASGHAYHKPSAQPTKPLQPSVSSFANAYDSYIRPQTAFTGAPEPKIPSVTPTYRNTLGTDTKLYNPKDYAKHVNGINPPVSAPPADPAPNEEEGERFELNSANITAKDLERVEGDSEKHMRELLSGAIGEVEVDVKDGDDVVEGFSESVRLMPHQVMGVKWMRGREKNRKYGGILADVS
jgi:hypothetical protein